MKSSSISFLARKAKPTVVSPFFFAVSLLVILILSWYPFSGWRFTGEPILAFFSYPLPYYFTLFDNAINILAYIPLGLSAAIIFRHSRLALIYATLIGFFISMGVEFVQQFLPSRIASNMDILSNGFGAFLGAVIGVLFSHRSVLRRWQLFRHDYLAPGAVVEWGAIWLLLWFTTQFDPSLPFLGVVVLPQGLPQPFVSPLNDPALFLRLLEGGGMMLHLLGVGLFVSVLVRESRQIPRAMFGVLFCALLMKMGFAGMLLQPEQFFAWLNLNIVLGGLVGGLVLWILWQLNRRLRSFAGFSSLFAATWVSYLWPLSPTESPQLMIFKWNYGHLQHFNGMSHAIGDVWPLGAMLFFLYFMAAPAQEQNW
ncbi:VanZ family protein [Deefgea tanakiae]|uniref:VanZ family protein n=1 Tax=Deefgea tanakiae TaxID=2865840 RepID=A0ABX8Z5V0_9NEIS|nr:VanZ family protein [Deefgea tanakiae]QZA77967.1 VanZ family protein [Deefgea tanakiae]